MFAAFYSSTASHVCSTHCSLAAFLEFLNIFKMGSKNRPSGIEIIEIIIYKVSY